MPLVLIQRYFASTSLQRQTTTGFLLKFKRLLYLMHACMPAILRFEFMRSAVLDPTLSSIEISDHFRSTLFQKEADRYVTVPRLRFRV